MKIQLRGENVTQQTKLAARDHPPVSDKLLALVWWWFPFFALFPILSKRSSTYVCDHLTAVRCTFITLFAFCFLILLVQSLALFAETGDALGQFCSGYSLSRQRLEQFFRNFGIVEPSTQSLRMYKLY